jgi:16S rRNA (cytosine967-C5)-methyltransferase
MEIAPARDVAFQILLRVATTDAHSDELLRTRQVDALTPQDRALTTSLVLGTLRWQIKLDARIRLLLSRPDAKLSTVVETALRLGAFQLLYLDRIPAYAAISDSVELAKQAGEAHAARMVNAVLRKLAKLPQPTEDPEPNSAKEIAESYAHPLWLVERWAGAYGLATAEAICRFDQQPALTSIRLLDPDAERDLVEEGIQLEPGEFLAAARRVVSGDIVRSRAFRERRIRIQDEGSQLIAELAGSGSRIGARSYILDTCAAPGGKTAILAERNPEATITAWDISKRRLDTMRREFAPAAGRFTFEVRDATTAVLKPEYDLILCDVPCSGTGTISRNPEIRFRISEHEIVRQHARQVKILSAALAGLTTTGRLLYSTCTLEPEENEAVVAECLAANRGFTIQPLDQIVQTLATAGILTHKGAERLRASALAGRFLQTIPGVNNCDGFFAALLMRN